MSVRIGIIGLGDIIETHFKAIDAHDRYEVAAVCDLQSQRVDTWVDRYGCRGMSDYRDLLAEGPDVVVITLPHGLHCQATIEALQAGAHVLVEKPMAVSAEQCRKMLAAARQAKRHLLVVELASFSSGAQRTAEKFVKGELGRFLTGSLVNMRTYFHDARPAWFLDPAMSGGGMFSNVGLHRLGTVRMALPTLRPVAVTADVQYVSDWDVEACTNCLVQYEGGGAMSYQEVGYFPRPEWFRGGLQLYFEEGFVTWTRDTWHVVRRDGAEHAEPLVPVGPVYAPIYENMLAAIDGGKVYPPAWFFAEDTAIAQAAYASARENRRIDLTAPEWAIERETT